VWGGLLRLGYRLAWHRIGPLPLGYWPLLIGILWLVVGGRTASLPYALGLSVVGFLLAVVMLIARQQGYIRFRLDESLAAHLPPDVSAIEADEKIPVRATGVLRVRDKARYFAGARTHFATMENREHIVMAQVPLSRMWLVARSLPEDKGW
jgi:hypothetical protein